MMLEDIAGLIDGRPSPLKNKKRKNKNYLNIDSHIWINIKSLFYKKYF